MNPNTPNFNPGGILDRVDNRDFQWSEVAGAAPLPFDWNAGFDIETNVGKLPVKNQDGSYSCGGQAWAQYAGVLETVASGTMEERSAKFFYAQTYQGNGGSTGRDNAEVFVNQGACYESILTSYQNGNPPDEAFITRGQDITDDARNNAILTRGFSYAQTGTHIDAVATAMRDNNGVILGIDGSNNGTWLTAFPLFPTVTEWRHWVYAGKAKVINGVKHIGFINSWGIDVGESGWQWLPEAYFTTGHVWSGWTHVLAPFVGAFTHTFNTTILFGTRGPEVVALQKVLQIYDAFPATVPATGFYGDITRRAVLKFRTKYGVSSTNDPLGKSVGPLTRQKLNEVQAVI